MTRISQWGKKREIKGILFTCTPDKSAERGQLWTSMTVRVLKNSQLSVTRVQTRVTGVTLWPKYGKVKSKGIFAHGQIQKGREIEDITRWREDMNFMFEWQEQYLTSERSERVRYCSCYENIKFISSSQRVIMVINIIIWFLRFSRHWLKFETERPIDKFRYIKIQPKTKTSVRGYGE